MTGKTQKKKLFSEDLNPSGMSRLILGGGAYMRYGLCSLSCTIILEYIKYYYLTERAIQGNIQFEGGSIGPTAGRDNTPYCLTQKECNKDIYIIIRVSARR